MVNTAEHVQKFRDEQKKHEHDRSADKFLKSLVYKWSPLLTKWFITALDKTVHGKTFYINFYYSIFQFKEKRITLRIFISKYTKLEKNDMKL